MNPKCEKLVGSNLKDPYKAHQARIFHIVVLTFGLILVVGSACLIAHNLMYNNYLNWISLFNGVAVFLGVVLSYLLSRKGHYHIGIYLFLIIVTICTTYALINRGLSFSIVLVYAIVVVMSGLLIGPKSSVLFGVFGIINYGMAFHWLLLYDHIRHPDITSLGIFNIVAFTSSIIVLVLLTSMVSIGLKQRMYDMDRINRARVKAMRETKSALHEKEILLREIHHRVKNNLQIISSLLSLQSTQHGDEKTHKMLMDTQNRVKSMALIHEKLYMTSDISQIDFDEYLKVLVNHMAMSYLINPESVQLKLDIDDITLDVDTAISCGLVINELVSNSMKHAFNDRSDGIIDISMKVDEKSNNMILTVSDNGIGIPPDLDIKNLESLGLQLVDTLVCEMKGHVRLINKDGTRFIITIPYGARGGK